MTAAERTMNAMNAKSMKTETSGEASGKGFFVLENGKGEIVRFFQLESSQVTVLYRHDSRRVEAVASTDDLVEAGVEFDVLAETTQTELRSKALEIGNKGKLRFVENMAAFSKTTELAPEEQMETKKLIGWSAALQLAILGLFAIGSMLGGSQKEDEPVVTLMTREQVEQMLREEQPKPEAPKTPPVAEKKVVPQVRKQKNIVVAPSKTKITKNTPVPKKSTSFKKNARPAKNKAPRGGGHKGEGRRGYGTNEPRMNSIGALGALKGRGNGGSGGLNLQAVGTNNGSGAGGQSYGGFGSEGAGGRGKGGLGKNRGSSGLANAMYGKGLVAAPHGDGSAAPGAGGYGTRGRAGGGARGAGYGSETISGSWKGTGSHGIGPAGSGAGTGLDGSPFGSVDGDSEDALVTGGLDLDQIEEVIRRNIGQIIYCYEQGLQKNSSLSGRVTSKFQIGAAGRVTSSTIGHSSVRSAQVERCIAGKVKGWKFPRPHGGVTVAVAKTFTLRRSMK